MNFLTSEPKAVNSSELFAVHTFLVRLCSSVGAVFLWVFIFVYLYSILDARQALATTLLLYALVQTIDVLLLPYVMRLLGSGMRRGLIWGTAFLAMVFVYASVLLTGDFPSGTAIIGVLLGAFGAFYRVPYSLERAVVDGVSSSINIAEAVIASAPLLAGVALSAGMTPSVLLLIAGLVAVVALFPLMFVPNVREQFMWGYRETFAHLFSSENKGLLVGCITRGVYSSLFFLGLPLTLFALTGSYLGVGALFSAILIVLLVLRSFSRGHAFLVQRADGGAYLDEYTALKEMALALGRLLLPLIVGIALLLGA